MDDIEAQDGDRDKNLTVITGSAADWSEVPQAGAGLRQPILLCSLHSSLSSPSFLLCLSLSNHPLSSSPSLLLFPL